MPHPEHELLLLEGKKISGDYKPSIESVYHAGIMKYRPEVNAVVHTHAPLSTIFGLCNLDILPVNTEAIFCMNMPRIPFYLGGTKELANAVIENVGKTKATGAFLSNHGLMTIAWPTDGTSGSFSLPCCLTKPMSAVSHIKNNGARCPNTCATPASPLRIRTASSARR